MAKAVYDPDADGNVVCADHLKTPRKLDSADFDGTAGVMLAQMTCQETISLTTRILRAPSISARRQGMS